LTTKSYARTGHLAYLTINMTITSQVLNTLIGLVRFNMATVPCWIYFRFTLETLFNTVEPNSV